MITMMIMHGDKNGISRYCDARLMILKFKFESSQSVPALEYPRICCKTHSGCMIVVFLAYRMKAITDENK